VGGIGGGSVATIKGELVIIMLYMQRRKRKNQGSKLNRKNPKVKKLQGDSASNDFSDITTEDISKIIVEEDLGNGDSSENPTKPEDPGKPNNPGESKSIGDGCKDLVEAINKLRETITSSGGDKTLEKAVAQSSIDIAEVKDSMKVIKRSQDQLTQQMLALESKITKLAETQDKLKITTGDIQAQVQLDAGAIDSLQSTVGELKSASKKF
jgi:hypothetical protein